MEIVENKFRDKVEQEESVAKYDPQKKYRWEPNTQFILNGTDFGIVLNTFRTILNTPISYQSLLMAARASEAIEEILARSVESGIVVEDIKK